MDISNFIPRLEDLIAHHDISARIDMIGSFRSISELSINSNEPWAPYAASTHLTVTAFNIRDINSHCV